MPRFTNSLLIIATAFLFSSCATPSNEQSAMEAEQENMQLAQILCYEHNNAEACFVLGGKFLRTA